VQENLNVFTSALDRVRYIYKEFDGNVITSNSGGKDSTVVVELAARVSVEMGYGPARVQWLDQECEFQATVDYQRYLKNDRVDLVFDWYQIPFRIFNATNHDYPWLNCWGEGEEWMRPKEPNSIQENTFGSDRFYDVLDGMNRQAATVERPMAVLTGMRCEESPTRRVLMLANPAYKWLTYSKGGPDHYLFHPIFDWTYRDVWKSIFENKWEYNDHYNSLFRYGIPPRKMRVSNFTHETALPSLHYLQEVEPETWEKATRRLAGVSTYGHIGKESVRTLPYMFKSWSEYVTYLIDNLSTQEYQREMFRKLEKQIRTYLPLLPEDEVGKVMASSVIGNDLYGSNVKQMYVSWKKIYGKNGSYLPPGQEVRSEA